MANSVLLSKTPGGSSSIWLSSKSLNGGLISLSKVDRFKFVYSFPLAPHPRPPSPPPPPLIKKRRTDTYNFSVEKGK